MNQDGNRAYITRLPVELIAITLKHLDEVCWLQSALSSNKLLYYAFLQDRTTRGLVLTNQIPIEHQPYTIAIQKSTQLKDPTSSDVKKFLNVVH